MGQQSDKLPKPGFVTASLILGLLSFIPLVGVLLGIIAIVLGIISIKKIKKEGLGGKNFAIAGITLGVLGIVLTVVAYGYLFYQGFVADTPARVKLTQEELNQNAGSLELYRKKFNTYPKTLEEVTNAGFTIFPVDAYQNLFYYKVSADGQSYELRSLGYDGEYDTRDDILFTE